MSTDKNGHDWRETSDPSTPMCGLCGVREGDPAADKPCARAPCPKCGETPAEASARWARIARAPDFDPEGAPTPCDHKRTEGRAPTAATGAEPQPNAVLNLARWLTADGRAAPEQAPAMRCDCGAVDVPNPVRAVSGPDGRIHSHHRCAAPASPPVPAALTPEQSRDAAVFRVMTRPTPPEPDVEDPDYGFDVAAAPVPATAAGCTITDSRGTTVTPMPCRSDCPKYAIGRECDPAPGDPCRSPAPAEVRDRERDASAARVIEAARELDRAIRAAAAEVPGSHARTLVYTENAILRLRAALRDLDEVTP